MLTAEPRRSLPRRRSRTRRIGRGLLAALLSLLGVLGCQPGAAATPSRAGGGAAEGAAVARPAAAPDAPALPTVRVAYGAGVGSMAPLWMAKAAGAFERAGVPVEVVSIQSSASIAALVAGEIDLVQVSAPGMIPAAVQGEDTKAAAGDGKARKSKSQPRKAEQARSARYG